MAAHTGRQPTDNHKRLRPQPAILMPRHEESRLQRACVRWFRYRYPRLALNLIAIPNGYKTTAMQAAIAKAEGLTAGAADLALFVPADGAHGLFVEMKTPSGRQQDTQKQWQQAVEQQGYRYEICRTPDDFMALMESYLGGL